MNALKALSVLLFFAVTGTAQPAAVFRKVLTGITTAQASAAVTNMGQTMHIAYVFFPGQTTTQSGIQVRIEASYDNVTYFPISEDITSAANVGGTVYDVVTAFGPWPYIRVRSLTTAPNAMTVWYAGHTIPTISTIQDKPDRFIL